MDPSAGISFIVTVYNKRRYLPAVAAGLVAQRGEFPCEFVFVDDGSTDGSREEIERLTAGWPDVQILSQANLGPSLATNRGLAAARYALIKLVDGDDVLLPGATALLRQAMLRHSEAVLAFGDAEGYATPEDAVARLRAAPPPRTGETTLYDALPAFLRNCDLGPSACMLRADAVQQAGGCDERVFVQDYSLFLRLAASGPFLRLAAPVVLAPQGARQHLNDGGPQTLHDMNLTLYYFLSERPLPRRMVKPAIRRGLRRAWHWARRREQAPILNRCFWRLVAAYLPFAARSPEPLRRSCAAFTGSRAVGRL